jgi:hypothetical protein
MDVLQTQLLSYFNYFIFLSITSTHWQKPMSDVKINKSNNNNGQDPQISILDTPHWEIIIF